MRRDVELRSHAYRFMPLEVPKALLGDHYRHRFDLGRCFEAWVPSTCSINVPHGLRDPCWKWSELHRGEHVGGEHITYTQASPVKATSVAHCLGATARTASTLPGVSRGVSASARRERPINAAKLLTRGHHPGSFRFGAQRLGKSEAHCEP